MLAPSAALAADGPFAARVPGFCARAGQQDIAEAIAAAIRAREVLICEAGTGTGKTLAYLTPALLSGRKLIVSTGTRNLQEQLFHRDLPLAREALGVPARVALLKGRSNYLCLHRLALHRADPEAAGRWAAELERIAAWAGATRSGDIAELAAVPEDAPVWPLATSTRDNCLGQDCPRLAECHVLAARRAAAEADLVVINHHLFLADAALKAEGFGELLPGADAVVLDEAHQLPEIATRFFGAVLGSRQLLDLARDARAARAAEAGDLAGLDRAARRLDTATRALRLAFGVEPRRLTWDEVRRLPGVEEARAELAAALAGLLDWLDPAAERGVELESCRSRGRTLAARLETLADPPAEDCVCWLDLGARGFSWHLSPLDVSAPFAARLAAQPGAWIFTSATLAVGGSFDHFASRLGIVERRERVWESPFDYERQALLYLPPGMPAPGAPEYTDAVVAVARPVIDASEGRAFVLFTSHAALARAAGRLRGALPWPLLVQGDLARSELLERFRSTPNAVLLGTGSFWEGVDVRGDALSCVIIDKLPFASPGEPLLRARIESLRAQGRNAFAELQLPQAVIALKQGCGRLIRDASDRGVLVVCDPRLRSRSYGRVFLDSLPPMPRTEEIADVRKFFERDR